MPDPRHPSASPQAALVLLGILVVLAVLGGGYWKLQRDHRLAQLDLGRELAVRATAARVGQFHQSHGALPTLLEDAAPGVNRPGARYGRLSYQRLDAEHFQLGIRFEAASSAAPGQTLGAAWRHPAGFTWFTFDTRKLEDPRSHWAPDPDEVLAANEPPAG